jgi:two-component system sensor histidine kinase BaeS
MMSALRRSLGVKIFASYLVVIVVGVGVLLTTSELTAPTAFAHHISEMRDTMGGMMRGSGMMADLFINYQAAVREALALAAGAAVVVALGVSVFVTRQVVRPVQQMERASQRIAEGHYAERVDVSGAPDEFNELDQLAVSFNRMASALEQTEAMRRQLIGDVAHELRTPLTTIKGTAEGLIDGVLPAEPETFHRIHKEADRLQRLVYDLQELSRVEARAYQLDRKPVWAGDLVGTVVERLGGQFDDKGVALVTDIPAGLPPVLADEDRIGQVLLNLVGNALQYTPSGGRVTLQAKRERDHVVFSVADTGIGIPAEHLLHLFTRFYRVDKSRSRAGGGSGIGLTISRYLIEAHDGTISATSPGPGQGSTFTFTLPVAHGHPPRSDLSA